MKHFCLRFLFLCLLSVVGAKAYAHDIEAVNDDGVTIYYNWIKNKTELAVCGSSNYSDKYSGNVVIPESVTYDNKTYSVTSIDMGAFYNCSGLTSVTIPNSVTSIGISAFSGCSGLTSIIVENGNIIYDSRDNCNAIIETASNTLIVGCSTTVIPNSVTSISDLAFMGSGLITSITIPSSVSSIVGCPFWGCVINSINVENGNTKYDSRNNCNAIIETASNQLIVGCASTVIPNSVTSIVSLAFAGCLGLTSFTIPNGIIKIPMLAFRDCI